MSVSASLPQTNESYADGYREGVLDAHCNQLPRRIVEEPESYAYEWQQFREGYKAGWYQAHQGLNHRSENEFCVWKRNAEYIALFGGGQ